MIRTITISCLWYLFLISSPRGYRSFRVKYFPKSFISPRSILLFFYSVCFCASSAWADETNESAYDSSTPTWYLGARAGHTYKYNSCVDIAIECDRNDYGYGIFAGYKTGKHFSVELSASDLGETTAIYPNVTLHGEINTADISLIYTHNLYKNIDVFGKIGVAYWEGKIRGWETVLEDSGERPIAGVGVQFPLFNTVDGRIEYQYFDQVGNHWMGYTDSHFLNFSLVWKFSSSKKYTTENYPHSTQQETISKSSFSTHTPVASTSTTVSKSVIHQHVESVLSDFIAEP